MCEALIVMGHNPDGTVTVGVSGTPDEILRLVRDAIDIVAREENGPGFAGEDFPLILIAGLELWCINNAATIEDAIQKMRERITLLIPKK